MVRKGDLNPVVQVVRELALHPLEVESARAVGGLVAHAGGEGVGC